MVPRSPGRARYGGIRRGQVAAGSTDPPRIRGAPGGLLLLQGRRDPGQHVGHPRRRRRNRGPRGFGAMVLGGPGHDRRSAPGAPRGLGDRHQPGPRGAPAARGSAPRRARLAVGPSGGRRAAAARAARRPRAAGTRDAATRPAALGHARRCHLGGAGEPPLPRQRPRAPHDRRRRARAGDGRSHRAPAPGARPAGPAIARGAGRPLVRGHAPRGRRLVPAAAAPRQRRQPQRGLPPLGVHAQGAARAPASSRSLPRRPARRGRVSRAATAPRGRSPS